MSLILIEEIIFPTHILLNYEWDWKYLSKYQKFDVNQLNELKEKIYWDLFFEYNKISNDKIYELEIFISENWIFLQQYFFNKNYFYDTFYKMIRKKYLFSNNFINKFDFLYKKLFY